MTRWPSFCRWGTRAASGRTEVRPRDEVKLAVLFTSGAEPDWPDGLDVYTGSFTYYGDNRSRAGICMTPRAGATCYFAWSLSGLTTGNRAERVFLRSSCSISLGGGGMCGSAPAGSGFEPAERRGRPGRGVADHRGPAVPELPRAVHGPGCRLRPAYLDQPDPGRPAAGQRLPARMEDVGAVRHLHASTGSAHCHHPIQAGTAADCAVLKVTLTGHPARPRPGGKRAACACLRRALAGLWRNHKMVLHLRYARCCGRRHGRGVRLVNRVCMPV